MYDHKIDTQHDNSPADQVAAVHNKLYLPIHMGASCNTKDASKIQNFIKKQQWKIARL